MCYVSVVVVKDKLGYDDSLDAFGVHGVGGMLGVLLVGVLATMAINPAGANGLVYGNSRQLLVQFVAVLVTAAYSFVLSFGLLKLVDKVVGLRVRARPGEHRSRPYPAPGIRLHYRGVGGRQGVRTMKYIIAIIQPDRLDDVIAALEEEEIILLTVSDVMGRGRQKGVAEVYRSHVERGGLLHKLKIEIAVSNNNVWQAVDAITRGARTGNIGDGKIFVLEMEECLRIRTGETGVSALA